MRVHMRRGMEQLYRPGDKEVIRHIAWGGSMAFRALLVLVTFAVMYGCEQASSPVEQQEKQAGVEEEKPKEPTPQRMEEAKAKEPAPQPKEPAQPVVGNIPIAVIVRENVEGSSFDLRVLDYFSADHYYYAIDRNVKIRCARGVCLGPAEDPPYIDVAEEASSKARRKFVVVNYSVTNTRSPQTIEPVLSAQLHVKGADRKTQVYQQTADVRPPHNLEDIPPHGLRLAQFIFDVPKEVEPVLLAVAKEATKATDSAEEVGVVDLRQSDPQGPSPEEILALQYEYFNMADYERVYDLYAQESKNLVSEQVYVGLQRQAEKEGGGNFIPSYSFPSVEIEGDRATVQVMTYSEAEGEGQHHAHRVEAVLDDEGWRIVMEDGLYIIAKCWENLGRLC